MQDTSILDLFSQLTDFQKEQLNREIHGYIQFNEFVKSSIMLSAQFVGFKNLKS